LVGDYNQWLILATIESIDKIYIIYNNSEDMPDRRQGYIGRLRDEFDVEVIEPETSEAPEMGEVHQDLKWAVGQLRRRLFEQVTIRDGYEADEARNAFEDRLLADDPELWQWYKNNSRLSRGNFAATRMVLEYLKAQIGKLGVPEEKQGPILQQIGFLDSVHKAWPDEEYRRVTNQEREDLATAYDQDLMKLMMMIADARKGS